MYCLYCKQRSVTSLHCVIKVAKRYCSLLVEIVRKWPWSLYLTACHIKCNCWKITETKTRELNVQIQTDGIRGHWGWLENRILKVVHSSTVHSSVSHVTCQIRDWWKKRVTERHLVCRPQRRFPPKLSKEGELDIISEESDWVFFFFLYCLKAITAEGSTQSGRLQRGSTVALNQSNQIISFPVVHLPHFNSALSPMLQLCIALSCSHQSNRANGTCAVHP